jgi:hypothetical protein
MMGAEMPLTRLRGPVPITLPENGHNILYVAFIMTSITFPGVNNGFQVGVNNGQAHLPPGRFRGLLIQRKPN